MPTFENRESLASVRTKINDSVLLAEQLQTELTSSYGVLATSVNNANSAAERAEEAADQASAFAGFRDFSDLPQLLANTSLSYSNAAIGDIVRTRSEGFAYQVAASGATDHHVTTAGGVKLYVLARAGKFELSAFGAVGNGTTDDTAAVQEWASQTGRLYYGAGVFSISTTIDVGSDRVEGVGTFQWDGAADGIMFNLTVASTKWRGGEVDGNLLAKIGIKSSTVGGHDIEGVEIHGLRSTTSTVVGVNLEGAVGSRVAQCTIYDLFSQGNATPGDNNGPARAILGTHNAAMTSPHIWEDNLIYDIWGEEGDGIQILLFDSTYPMKTSARSTIRRNRIYGCGRRAIKVQASDVIVVDNDLSISGGSPPPSQSSIPEVTVLNIIDGENCVVTGNVLRGGSGYTTISLTDGGSTSRLVGDVISNNDITGPTDAVAVFLDRMGAFSVSGNRISGGTASISVGDSIRGAVWDNQFIASATSSTLPDINITSTCSEISVARNIGLGGTKARLVTAAAGSSAYIGNTVFRDAGTGVFVSGAIEAIVDNTVVTGSGDPVQTSANSARIGGNVNLGSGSSGFGAALFWSNGDPTTARSGRKHKIGDIAFNTVAGVTVGWRCTASGTPGTWAAFT